MNGKKNPFSLSFGRIPPEYIVRSNVIERVVETFMNDPVTVQNYIITGVRGSGKTVTMTAICDRFKETPNWHVIKISPLDDILKVLLKQLQTICGYLHITKSVFNIGIPSLLNISVEKDASVELDINTQIDSLLEKLSNKNQNILVSIDEITDTTQMRKFSSALQMFITNNRPIYFIGTGLFEEIDKLKNIPNLTFLYRTPKLQMTPLNIIAMAQAYQRSFKISEGQAHTMANMTKGYSYAFQVLGYLYWDIEDKTFPSQLLLNQFDMQLADASYSKLWMDLSDGDRTVVLSIAQNEGGKTKNIASYANMDGNKFNQYRRRLKDHGIIDVSQYGKVSFALPRFKEFVLTYGVLN